MGVATLVRLLVFTLGTVTVTHATSWTDEGCFDTNWYHATQSSFSISNAQQLAGMAVLVNHGNDFTNKTVTLVADISLADKDWTAIGKTNPLDASECVAFAGTFNGNEKTIGNLGVAQADVSAQGFFAVLNAGGVVRNVILSGVNVVGYRDVGSVVGRNSGTIENCASSGTVNGQYSVGGEVGWNGGIVKNCTNLVAVVGNSVVGGLVGENSGGTVQESLNAGGVDGSANVGGVMGNNDGGTVSACQNTGFVNGTQYVGGVAGSSDGTVRNCTNLGDVQPVETGAIYFGGIAGANGGTVENCENQGFVTCFGYVGGVTGLNGGTVQNCKNAGYVAGTESVGGIVGFVKMNGVVQNCMNTGGGACGVSWLSVGGVIGAFEGTETTGAQDCYWKNDGTEGFTFGAVQSGNSPANCYSFGAAPGTLTEMHPDYETFDLCETLNSWVARHIAETPTLRWWSNGNSCLSYPGFTDAAPKVTVSFDANGGTGAATSVVATAGSAMPDTTAPTYGDYVFKGYYDAQVGGTKYYNADLSGARVWDKVLATTLYAQWRQPSWTEDGNFVTNWYNDSESSFTLSNAQQLAGLAVLVNSGTVFTGKTIVLVADVDLTGKEWTAIGSVNGDRSEINAFDGVFDGNGRTLAGVGIDQSEAESQGFFAIVGKNGTVRNVTLSGVTVIGSGTCGGVVAENGGRVENCTLSGTVSGTTNVAGVVGKNTGTVLGCTNSASVSGVLAVGGTVGRNSGGTVDTGVNEGAVSGYSAIGGVVGENETGTVCGCSNAGSVDGSYDSGGIAGYNGDAVLNCKNTGGVNGSETSAGGIVGSNYATVLNCENTAAVSGNEYVGGISGANYGAQLSNCANFGTVSATGDYVGGVAGTSYFAVLNCVNTAAVSGDSYCGGVVGEASWLSLVQNCYWKMDGTTGFDLNAVFSGGTTDCYAFALAPGSLNAQHSVYQTNDLCAVLNAWVGVNLDTTPALVLWTTADSESGYPVLVMSGIQVTVTFDANGGSGGATSVVATAGSPMPDTGLAPVREGCVFKGYFDAQTGGTQYYSADMSSACLWNKASDTTLYAHWGKPNWAEEGSYDTSWYDEAQSSFTISNAQQLAGLAVLVNSQCVAFSDKVVALTSDIDLSARDWTAIGLSSPGFMGVFDGGGKVITGLAIDDAGADCQGLFGYLNGGTVQNVELVAVSVCGQDNVGGVAGYNNYGTVQNCMSAGAVSGRDCVGGMAGRNNGGTVQNCRNSCSVRGNDSVGGVAGRSNYSGVLRNCMNAGPVSGISCVGGVAGYSSGSSTACDCYWKKDGTADFNLEVTGSGSGTYCYSFGAAPGVLSAVHDVYATDDLCAALNAWVSDAIGENASLAGWTATASGYPIVKMLTQTQGSPVPVPYAWLDSDALKTYLSGQNVDTSDHEAMAIATGANGYPVWESYVAGLDPVDAESRFEARISFDAGGNPVITYTPDLGAQRTYSVQGKESLSDSWGPSSSNSRFFRVKVELP